LVYPPFLTDLSNTSCELNLYCLRYITVGLPQPQKMLKLSLSSALFLTLLELPHISFDIYLFY
jgi:hypothetical protein